MQGTEKAFPSPVNGFHCLFTPWQSYGNRIFAFIIAHYKIKVLIFGLLHIWQVSCRGKCWWGCLGVASKSHWNQQEVSESVNGACILFLIIRLPVKRLLNSKTWSSSLLKSLLSCLLLLAHKPLKVWLLGRRQTCRQSLFTAWHFSSLHYIHQLQNTPLSPFQGGRCWTDANFPIFPCLPSTSMSAAYFQSSQKLACNILQGPNKSSSWLKKIHTEFY